MFETYSTDEIDAKFADLPVPKDGEDGVKGDPGLSAYDVAVANGFSGTQTAWLASLKGTPGQNGLGGSAAHGLWLDDMVGDTDDSKLDSALKLISSGQVSIPILLSNRTYSFAKPRVLTSGIKIINPFGFGDQARGANSIPCLVKYTGTGAWWTVSGNVFDVHFQGFGLQGNKNSKVWHTPSGSVLWTSVFRDLGFTEWASIWGSPTAPFYNDAITIDGFINMNNFYDCPYNFAGSDSNLFMGFTLVDTPTVYSASNPGHYQGMFTSQSKTEIGPMYVTAEGCKGILFQGKTNGRTTFNHPKVEGRNLNAPSLGPLIEVRDGQILVDKPWLGYTKSDYVLQSGGFLLLDGPNFGDATGAGHQVLTQTGGQASIVNASATWSGAPTVKGSSISHDNYVSSV